MAQPNQFTKAKELGVEPPKAQNQFTTGKRDQHAEETLDKMRAAKAAAKLEEILEDPGASKSDQIAAGKELMRYGKLTADRRSEADENAIENRPEEEIETLIQALITAHPRLASKLNIGLRAVEAPQQTSVDVTNEAQEASK
jgi:hypothetical protein